MSIQTIQHIAQWQGKKCTNLWSLIAKIWREEEEDMQVPREHMNTLAGDDCTDPSLWSGKTMHLFGFCAILSCISYMLNFNQQHFDWLVQISKCIESPDPFT